MDGSDATTAAEALDGRYADLCTIAHTLSTDELLEVIELSQREIDAASARQAIALAHLSARDEHRQEDGTRVELHHGLGHQRLDAPELAASRMGVSAHVAENRVTDAIDQLTRTPTVVDAMASGELDQRRAAIVTEETEFLSSESAAAVVALVAPRWRGVTAGPLRRMVARAAAQVDPEAVAAQAAQARERRGLIRRVGVDGTDHWRGDFRVEQSRPTWAAVTERGRQLVRTGHAASLAQGRSDAMMELILEHCEVRVVLHATHPADPSTGADPSGDPAPPPASGSPSGLAPTAAPDRTSGVMGGLVEVGGLGAPGTTFVPETWLRHQKRTSVSTKRRQRTSATPTTTATVGDPPDSDPTGRDPIRSEPTGDDDVLRCHPATGALVQGVVAASLVARGARFIQNARTASINSAGDIHDGYRIPAPLRRFVYLRDGGCRFPGCMVAARLCDVDHVTPWPDGPTASRNLIALCRRHHRIKQRDGWSVRLEPDGRVRWCDPSGHQRMTWPVDHLHLVNAASPGAKAHPGATPARSDDLPAHQLQWLRDDPLPTILEEELAELLEAEYRTPWGRRLERERAARVSMAHDDGSTPLAAPTPIDLFDSGFRGPQLVLAMQPPPPEPIPF